MPQACPPMSAPTVHSGGMLGRYRLLEQIGAGGMGVVYRAHDERLARDVAIKLLNPGSIRSAIARHRVRNEALALSRLSHPNIETIFEFDTQDDCDFLVVELIPGVSLDELLSRGPLPETLAVSLTIQLLRGLAAAHEKGIIHRDLKPSNLRLTHDSFLKILDFGLAHIHDEEEPKTHNLTTETHSTVLSGTLAYMSPEQLRGTRLDPRSDIYAAGLVLYQMCTGRLPFTESGALLIDAILNRPITQPRKINRDGSKQIEAVILQALEKEPKRRYQSAREMLRDLEAIDAAIASSAGNRALSIAIVTILVLVFGLIIGLERRRIAGWIDRQLHPVPTNKYVAVMPFRSSNNDDPAFDEGLAEAVAAKLTEITAAQSVQIVSPREIKAERVEDIADAHKKMGVNLAIAANLQRIKGTTRGVGFLENETVPEDVDSAIVQFQQALTLDPGYARASAGLGLANFEKYRLTKEPSLVDKARSACERALTLDAQSPQGNVCLGVVHHGIGQYQAAVLDFQMAIAAEPNDDEAYRELASAFVELNRMQDAEDTYKKAISIHPQYASGYGQLAHLYRREAKYTLAIAEYKKAIELAPEDARYWFSHGAASYNTGDYARSIDAFQNSTTLPPSFQAYSNLGLSYLALRRFPEAIASFEQAVAMGSHTIQTFGNLGQAYYFYPSKRDLARSPLEKALQLAADDLKVNPQDADVYTLAAEYSAMIGERAEALQQLNKALQLRPNDAETLYFAGIVHAVLGDKDEAIPWLQAAMKRGYSRAEIDSALELDELRNSPEFKSHLTDVH